MWRKHTTSHFAAIDRETRSGTLKNKHSRLACTSDDSIKTSFSRVALNSSRGRQVRWLSVKGPRHYSEAGCVAALTRTNKNKQDSEDVRDLSLEKICCRKVRGKIQATYDSPLTASSDSLLVSSLCFVPAVLSREGSLCDKHLLHPTYTLQCERDTVMIQELTGKPGSDSFDFLGHMAILHQLKGSAKIMRWHSLCIFLIQ